MIHVYAGTKFPIHKEWWLREAAQIEQTCIPLFESRLKHSTAEFQSIHQFGRNLTSLKTKNAEARV